VANACPGSGSDPAPADISPNASQRSAGWKSRAARGKSGKDMPMARVADAFLTRWRDWAGQRHRHPPVWIVLKIRQVKHGLIIWISRQN